MNLSVEDSATIILNQKLFSNEKDILNDGLMHHLNSCYMPALL